MQTVNQWYVHNSLKPLLVALAFLFVIAPLFCSIVTLKSATTKPPVTRSSSTHLRLSVVLGVAV